MSRDRNDRNESIEKREARAYKSHARQCLTMRFKFWVWVTVLVFIKVIYDLGVTVTTKTQWYDMLTGNYLWVVGIGAGLFVHHLMALGWRLPSDRSKIKYLLGTTFLAFTKVWWDLACTINSNTNWYELFWYNSRWIAGISAILLGFYYILFRYYFPSQKTEQMSHYNKEGELVERTSF